MVVAGASDLCRGIYESSEEGQKGGALSLAWGRRGVQVIVQEHFPEEEA